MKFRTMKTPYKLHAKVLGCLAPGKLTIVLGPDIGLLDGGIPIEIPMEIVPFDLRMPNSRFYVVQDFAGGEIVSIERVGAQPPNLALPSRSQDSE